MKKILFFAAAALSLAACSNEGVITGGVDIPQPSEGTNLSFNLSLPNGEPITYAGVHTDTEKNIQQIDVYQFSGTGDNKLEAVYKNATIGAEVAGKRPVTIHVKSNGNKKFVLVANNISSNPGSVPSINNPATGTSGITLAAFKASVTNPLPNNTTHLNGKPLLMSGESGIINVLNAPAVTAEVPVQLTRVMARIDILNKDNNLKINRVQLFEVKDRAYLFAKDTTEGAAGTTAAPVTSNINLPLVTLPSVAPGNASIGYATTTVAGEVHYKHVFYPYPSNKPAVSGKAAVVFIEGTLYPNDPERKQKVVYKHELKKEGENTFLGFKRNHVYTLVISKATRDELDATLKVDKWNEVEITSKNVEVTTPEVVRFIAEASGVTYSLTAKTVTVSKAGAIKEAGALIFDVKSTTDWEFTVQYQTGNGWITNIKEPFNSEYNPSINALNNRVRFSVAANTASGAVVRTAKLIFRSKVDPTKKVEFTLTQQK